MDGTTDNSRNALKILNALKIDNEPEDGINAILTIMKSKMFHPFLKKLIL